MGPHGFLKVMNSLSVHIHNLFGRRLQVPELHRRREKKDCRVRLKAIASFCKLKTNKKKKTRRNQTKPNLKPKPKLTNQPTKPQQKARKTKKQKLNQSTNQKKNIPKPQNQPTK